MDKRLEELRKDFRDSHLYSQRSFPEVIKEQSISFTGDSSSGSNADKLASFTEYARKPVLVQTYKRSSADSSGIIWSQAVYPSDVVEHVQAATGRWILPIHTASFKGANIADNNSAYQMIKARPVYEVRYYGQMQLIGLHYLWFYPLANTSAKWPDSGVDNLYQKRFWCDAFSNVCARSLANENLNKDADSWSPDISRTATPWDRLHVNATLAWQCNRDLIMFQPSHNKVARITVPWTTTRPMICLREEIALGTVFLCDLTGTLVQDSANNKYTIQIWRYFVDLEFGSANFLVMK